MDHGHQLRTISRPQEDACTQGRWESHNRKRVDPQRFPSIHPPLVQQTCLTHTNPRDRQQTHVREQPTHPYELLWKKNECVLSFFRSCTRLCAYQPVTKYIQRSILEVPVDGGSVARETDRPTSTDIALHFHPHDVIQRYDITFITRSHDHTITRSHVHPCSVLCALCHVVMGGYL